MLFHSRRIAYTTAFQICGPSFWLVMIITCLIFPSLATSAQTSPTGVIVDSIEAGSPAEKSGLRPGDILLWIADRPINSPADLAAAEANLVNPTMHVKTLRGNQMLEHVLDLKVPLSKTGLIVRPPMPIDVLAVWRAGCHAQYWKQSIAHYRSALKMPAVIHDKQLSGWIYFYLAISYRETTGRLSSQVELEEAEKATRLALDASKERDDKAAQAALLECLAHYYFVKNDLVGASGWNEQMYQVASVSGYELWAAAARSRQGGIAMSLASIEEGMNLGKPSVARVKLAKAQDYFSYAFKVYERLTSECIGIR